MKVLRYSAIAAVAMFAAACGDKVTVAGPTAVTLTTTTTTTTTPVAPGKINSIAVAPAAVTLTIGQAVTLVAAVNADPGVATTVTWSSSDATKASVSAAGLVTAVAATPGVAICATSTVNVGVRGCASAVVVAASATVPATASIAGVYVSNVSTPITPTNVSGSVFVSVNVDPGTETISKVYLKLGTVVADSQVFTAAQSAALRNAVETANETGAQAAGENMANATSTILLTANTAKFNATTGAVSFANGSVAMSVELYVSGTATARSTAKYSSDLTLNNADKVTGTYTYPSTKVNANDAEGYSWTSLRGGNLAVGVVPVLYSGKTLSSATVAFRGLSVITSVTYCDITGADAACTALANTDTLISKTVTASGAFSSNFALHDREMDRSASGQTVAAPLTPHVTMTFTDGSSFAAAPFDNASTLLVRFDNKGPANVTLTAMTNAGSLSVLRGNVSFGLRIVAADSAKLISAFGADGGVSNGVTLTDLRGTTYTVYRNAGGTTTATDTVQSFTINHGQTADVSTLVEGTSSAARYCVRVTQSDALGNAAVNANDSRVKTLAQIAQGCPAFGATSGGKILFRMDKTLPVVTWASTSFALGDTAVSSVAQDQNVFYTVTDNNASGTNSVKACAYTTSGSSVTAANHNNLATTTTAACDTYVTQAAFGGVADMISTATYKWAQAAISTNGTYRLDAKTTDAAGYASAVLTKYVVVDNVAPSAVTTPAVGSTTLGTGAAVNGYASDALDVRASALTISTISYTTNSTTISGSVNLSSGRAEAVLEQTATVINGTLTTPTSSRFLNVAISGTGDIQYIAPLLANQTAGTLNQSGVSATANEGTGLVNGPRTKFALRAYDQVGNTTLGSYAAGTIADSITTFGLASRFAVVGNGFFSGADSTTPNQAGTKGDVGAVIGTALTTALATSTKLNTQPLRANQPYPGQNPSRLRRKFSPIRRV